MKKSLTRKMHWKAASLFVRACSSIYSQPKKKDLISRMLFPFSCKKSFSNHFPPTILITLKRIPVISYDQPKLLPLPDHLPLSCLLLLFGAVSPSFDHTPPPLPLAPPPPPPPPPYRHSVLSLSATILIFRSWNVLISLDTIFPCYYTVAIMPHSHKHPSLLSYI